MKYMAAYQGKFGIKQTSDASEDSQANTLRPAPLSLREDPVSSDRGRFSPPAQPSQQRTAPVTASSLTLPNGKRRKSKKKKHRQRVITIWIIVLALMLSYFAIFWIPWVEVTADGRLQPHTIFGRLQNKLITNSRESRSFQWVQFAYPWYIRQIYIDAEGDARTSQYGFITELNPEDIKVTDPINGEPNTTPTEAQLTEEQIAFYELFWELDFNSMEDYIKAHPSVIADGYASININEAGLDDDGTSIYTTKGEQVLAIDAYNGVLLVRVTGDTYRGVLATAKDPARLHLYVSSGMSTTTGFEGYGQTAGTIASNHNGILAITASGFYDENGVGTGGALAGFCRSDGVSYGQHRYWGSKRLELHEDHWLYITDAPVSCGDTVTNAMEFEPAMICDGIRQPNYIYTSDNPRACVGQNDKGEILFLAIEGRRADCPGCSVSVCTDILLEHRCINAMNMDGGTSAMIWYDGEPVIRCSNASTPEGRYLPNAWVYVRKDG